MKLKENWYLVLKWVCLIAFPAVSVLYVCLANVWKLPLAYEITTTIDAVAVFIGSLIGISTYNYNKGKTDEGEGDDTDAGER